MVVLMLDTWLYLAIISIISTKMWRAEEVREATAALIETRGRIYNSVLCQ